MAISICRALTGARLLLPPSPSPSTPSLFSTWKPSLLLPPCPSSSSSSSSSSSPTLFAITRIGVGVGVSQHTISGPAARAFSQQHNQTSKRKLVLYSKPECCLCENLKEKLNLAFTMDTSGSDHSPLSDIQLEVRNITTNAEWEAAYQYEIPVLAWVNEDGTERILPRLSPRLSVELIQKKLLVTMSS